MEYKIFFVSLGCDKNLVDSEMMISSLRKSGFAIVDDECIADVIVVNTCCFIGDAKEESINALIEYGRYKEEAKCRLLVAAGCLAQRYQKEIAEDIPEVDIIVGTMGYEKLSDIIKEWLDDDCEEKKLKNSPLCCMKDINYLPEPDIDRDSMTGGYYGYLKIAEGCDKCCTYCIIPKVRGKYRSVEMEDIIKQAEHLVKNGAGELILVAQETTLYGVDIYGKKSLHVLLEKLSGIDGLRWIRILYCYPEEIDDDLINAISSLPKVCNYIDIPIQHSSDRILKKMGRHTNRESIRKVVGKLRDKIPDIAIRTTIITGFPGETEEDFDDLKDFVREMRFDRLGVFAYSREEDTPAAVMPEQIDEEIKNIRKDKIMEIQQEIAFELSQERVGVVMDVMVQGYLSDDGVYICRSYMDAPDVDGFVFVKTALHLQSGDFIKVKIIAAKDYDLIGEIV